VALKQLFLNAKNLLMMKLITMVLFLLSLSPVLFAQNRSDKPTKSPAKTPVVLPEYSTYEWESMNFYLDVSSVYSQGAFKKFVKPMVAISMGFEKHKRHIYTLGVTMRPTKLRQSFVNENRTWEKDTTLSFATLQGSFGYQYWASKRVALYLFAGVGLHGLTAGKNTQNNNSNNPPKTEAAFSLVSFAPSMGFFLDYRTRRAGLNAGMSGKNYQDSYFRLKFSANPVWFKQLGDGILFDSGIAVTL
jgi:hypothetical protein